MEQTASPITHLESYQIKEHAKASVAFPLLLRSYMTAQWMNIAHYQAASHVFARVSQTTVKGIIVASHSLPRTALQGAIILHDLLCNAL